MDVTNLPDSAPAPPRPAAAHRRLEPGLEPIPGYRLLSPLGSGSFGEVWKCQVTGGLLKAIKFVLGEPRAADRAADDPTEYPALDRIKAIRHPFLLSLERLQVIDGDLILVTELADRTLADMREDFRRQGLPGLARDWLLALLTEAAEALDHINFQHDLAHLNLKPQNLFLVSNHVKVADFGLVQCLRELTAPAERAAPLMGMTPLYTAPEVQQGVVSRHSDQYSLAIVYVELLTGKPPFHGRNARQLAYQHASEPPDLTLVPSEDRAALNRALAKDPNQRYPSCLDFLHALKTPPFPLDRAVGGRLSPVTDTPVDLPVLPEPLAVRPDATRVTPRPAGPADEGPMLLNESASPEFLPNYRFLNCLSRNPVSESWLVQTPKGTRKLARILNGLPDAEPSGTGRDPLERLKFLNHPNLVPFDVVHREPGRAVLITDLPEQTLRDQFNESQALKLNGVPRDELLGYLYSVAQTLDTLAQKHSLYHLGLNPGNLLVDRGKVLLAEFGFVHWLWHPAGQPVAAINLRYAAPELFERKPHRTSDQFTLALIYSEMATGAHPLHGQPRPRVAGDRYRCRPDLRLLSRFDRDAIARALSVDPRNRHDSCTALIQALDDRIAVQAEESSSLRPARAPVWPLVIQWPIVPPPSDPDLQYVPAHATSLVSAPSPVQPAQNVTLDDVLLRLIATVAGDFKLKAKEQLHYVIQPGDLLEHRCAARLPQGVARVKLSGFIDQWGAEVVRRRDDQFILSVPLQGSFWQRWMGKHPSLEVQIRLLPPRRAASLTEVYVTMRPKQCKSEMAERVLQETAPAMLESLRTYLQAYPEQRHGQRLPWDKPVRVCQVPQDLQPPRFLEGQGKDLSPTGLGFKLPGAPTTQLVYLNLDTRETANVALLAKIVRVRPLNDGWYEVGARFEGLSPGGRGK